MASDLVRQEEGEGKLCRPTTPSVDPDLSQLFRELRDDRAIGQNQFGEGGGRVLTQPVAAQCSPPFPRLICFVFLRNLLCRL